MKSHKETALFFTDLQFSKTIIRFLAASTASEMPVSEKVKNAEKKKVKKAGGEIGKIYFNEHKDRIIIYFFMIVIAS